MKKNILLAVILMLSIVLSACSLPSLFSQKNIADEKLLRSIEIGNYEAVKEAIDDGANIDKLSGSFGERTDNGIFEKNPFRIACFLHKWNIAKYLIQRGANPNAIDIEGKPILFYVVEKGNLDLCKTLLKYGANINTKDKSENIALDFCFYVSSSYTYDNYVVAEKMYDFLIANGATLSSHIINTAIEGENSGYCNYNLLQKITKQLVSTGQNTGLSPLSESIILGDLSKSNKLVKGQNKIDKKVLFFAAAFGDYGLLQVLIDKGMDIYSKDADENNSLAIAVLSGNINTLKFLVPRFRLNGNDGYFSLEKAISNNQLETAKVLIARGAKIMSNISDSSTTDMLSCACANGNLEIAKLLIDNSYPKEGYSQALQTAAQFNQVKILSYLISLGPDINSTFNETTVLNVASFWGSTDCVRVLISNGANINGSPNLVTPLTKACNMGQTDVAKFLIEKGADVNIQPAALSEQLPLQKAINSGSFDIVKLLIEHGARVNADIVKYADGGKSTNILNYLKTKTK